MYISIYKVFIREQYLSSKEILWFLKKSLIWNYNQLFFECIFWKQSTILIIFALKYNDKEFHVEIQYKYS